MDIGWQNSLYSLDIPNVQRTTNGYPKDNQWVSKGHSSAIWDVTILISFPYKLAGTENERNLKLVRMLDIEIIMKIYHINHSMKMTRIT